MAWRSKKCGADVEMIKTDNITATYEITKNKKRGKLKSKVKHNWEVGYICVNGGCENNQKYNEFLEDISNWEE